MRLRYLPLAALIAVEFQALVMAQVSSPAPRQRLSMRDLPQPSVPNDPLELAATGAQPTQNAEQRQAAVNLLATARFLSNVRAQPYDLKTTFVTAGSSAFDGEWSLEDISPSGNSYRWTAKGPNSSIVNLYTHKLLYSNQPATAIPLRLAQVRSAIFFVHQMVGPQASIRTVNANLNDAELTCILLNRGVHAKAAPGGRRWEEQEYCIDPKSGLLVTYSPVPGVYVQYDYSSAFHFHGEIIPGKFSITQGGQPVVQARVESVTDPTNASPSLFDPAGLNQIGVGALMTPAWHVRGFVSRGGSDGNLQIVVLHGMLSPEGVLSETEILASSDAALNEAALTKAAAWQNWRANEEAEPGATPQSHEVFFTVQFGPAN